MPAVIERPSRPQTRSRFFLGMAVAAAVTVLIGFAPTFYLRGHLPMRPDQPALTPLLFIHGVLGTAWIALFLAQSLLIVSHRVALHKRLGVAGGVLAALVVGVGMMTAVDALRRNVVLIFVLTDLFVIVAAWYDLRVRGRIHPALARGGLAVIIIQPIVLALGTTSPLLALADRFR